MSNRGVGRQGEIFLVHPRDVRRTPERFVEAASSLGTNPVPEPPRLSSLTSIGPPSPVSVTGMDSDAPSASTGGARYASPGSQEPSGTPNRWPAARGRSLRPRIPGTTTSGRRVSRFYWRSRPRTGDRVSDRAGAPDRAAGQRNRTRTCRPGLRPAARGPGRKAP
jgi:hypothetical protein